MNWKYIAGVFAAMVALGLLFSTTGTAEEADFDEVTVHLSPDCGCCVQHAQYLERAGAEVEIIEHNNLELQELYDNLNIPDNYRACHLTEVDNYSVLGHVPIDVFNEIVEEEPDADVITLPGMPSGSPGMPGTKSQEWTFFKVVDGEIEEEFTAR